MSVKITCINKDNGDHYDPNEGITDLGWIDESSGKTGESSRADMVKFLKNGGKAYVKDSATIAYLVVRTSQAGNEYVKTIADGRETNNLLSLIECK